MQDVSSNALITAKNLTLIRQGKTLLQYVNLTIQPHDFITIVGPNGAGKSLLMKTLIGLITPDAGTIERMPALRIGYVPQRMICDTGLPMQVRYFLTLGKKVPADVLEQAIKDTQIQLLLSKQLSTLSGGELQRVLLARALLCQPDILMLDEPAQNLDISGQLAFYALLEKLYHDKNLSILMISHDLHLVMRCTRHVICLYHHICCEGAPEHITAEPAFVELFGQDMTRMMAMVHHAHDHRHHV